MGSIPYSGDGTLINLGPVFQESLSRGRRARKHTLGKHLTQKAWRSVCEVPWPECEDNGSESPSEEGRKGTRDKDTICATARKREQASDSGTSSLYNQNPGSRDKGLRGTTERPQARQ